MKYDFSSGLDTEKYKQNVTQYGLNKLPEKEPPTKVDIFLNQVKSPLIFILVGAGVATFALGDHYEAIAIFLIVVINSVLGFVQENNAEATLASLNAEVKPTSQVIRNGKEIKVATNDVTVGDLVVLRMGDKMPADGIMIESERLSANESVLTGESKPVDKEIASEEILAHVKANGYLKIEEIPEENMVYMGTAVMNGVGKMLVTAIGKDAKFGKIADSIANEEEPLTPLQARLNNFSRTLTIIIAILTVIIFAWGYLGPIHYELVELIELAISVAVSTVPEGLAVALTIILTLGMSRVLKKKALVRKLVSAETLGSVDTICVDKTGTLTEGIMQVAEVKFKDEEMGKRALLATNNKVNAVDLSVYNWLQERMKPTEKAKFLEEEIQEKKVFNSSDKFAGALGAENIYIVGAPEIVLQNTNLNETDKQQWADEIDYLARKGNRIVAVAYKPRGDEQDLETLPEGLTWVGLVLIDDPIRPNLLKTFQQAASAGISIKVITGDIGSTAMAVMQRIGIDIGEGQAMSGKELAELSDEELVKRLPDIKLFYRTTPDQKLKIVKALQAEGHSVAMMGDGINDTPALNKAEIGIVVNNATSFSKEIADMILLDSNFQTIIDAVAEGRNIFQNMKKVITYLLVDAFDVLVLVLGSVLLGIPTPISALQILYINFLADGLPDIALAFEEAEPELMKEPPKPKNYPLIDQEVRSMIITIGFVITSIVLGAYIWAYNAYPEQLPLLRTLVFTTIGIDSLVYVFSIKSFHEPLWKEKLFNNKLLNGGVLFGLIAMVAAVYVPFLQNENVLGTVPLPWYAWLGILLKAAFSIVVIEAIKYQFLHKPKQKAQLQSA